MANKRSDVIIGYQVDSASANKAVQSANRVSGAIEDGTDKAIENTKRLKAEQAGFISQLRAGTQTANDYYDRVNQDVGLAGDVASNAAQVAGALDAIGASFAGGALQSFVIAGDVLEGLPRLKASIAGLPAVLGNVVTSLGPTGLGLTAVAGLAVVAFAGLASEIDKARIAGEQYAQAQIQSAQTVADARIALIRGDTDTALRQLQTAQDERLALILEQQQLTQLVSELEGQAFGELPEALRTGYAAFLRGTSDSAEALGKVNERLKELDGELLNTATSQNELTALLMEFGFTTEQIEQAILALDQTTEQTTETVNELNSALLAQADATRARYLEEISLNEQSADSLRARQAEIQNEIEANWLAIATLEASGDTSEAVVAQIEKYRKANEELGKTLDFIGNTALPSAQARMQAEQARADTEQTQKDMVDATKKFNADIKALRESEAESLYKIEETRTQTLLDIAKKYADDTAKALQSFNDNIADLRKRNTEDELKARENALREDADATRKHYEALADISVNAKRAEQDAIRGLDFKTAFETRRNKNREIEDAQKSFTREAKERAINQDRERQDRIRAYEQALADARVNYQKELAQARQAREQGLQLAQQTYQKELQLAQQSNAQKLATLQAGYMQELALAQQTAAQRLQIEANLQAQLLAQAQRTMSFGFGGLGRAPMASNYRGATPPPNTQPNQRITNQNLERQRAMERARGGVTININNPNNPQRTAEQIKIITNNNRGGG